MNCECVIRYTDTRFANKILLLYFQQQSLAFVICSKSFAPSMKIFQTTLLQSLYVKILEESIFCAQGTIGFIITGLLLISPSSFHLLTAQVHLEIYSTNYFLFIGL